VTAAETLIQGDSWQVLHPKKPLLHEISLAYEMLSRITFGGVDFRLP